MGRLERVVDGVRRVLPIGRDLFLALAVMSYGLIELAWFGNPGNLSTRPFHLSHWSLVVYAMMALPLAFRRRSLPLSYAMVQAATLIGILGHVETNLFDEAGSLLMIVLIFSVADRTPAWVALIAVAVQLVILVAAFETLNPLPHQDHVRLYYAGVGLYLPVWVFPFFFGWAGRRRRALTGRLEIQANELRIERERLASQAVEAERGRIAQDLRSLVSRGVERIADQTRWARRLLQARSPTAAAEITTLEATGRQTLVEMRRLVFLLRGTEPSPPSIQEDPSPPLAGHRVEEDGARRGLRSIPSWGRSPWVADLGLALLLWAGIRAGWIALSGAALPGGLDGLTMAVVFAALLVRSRLPFSTLCVISLASFIWIIRTGDTPSWTQVALFLASSTVAASKGPRWAVAAVAVVLLAWTPYPFTPLCSGLCLFDVGTLAIFSVLGGLALRTGREINRELEHLTDLLARTRHERVRLAVLEERTRMARDLHDVVAHALTVMVVQAGAARALAPKEPERADQALAAVEETTGTAVRELEDLFGQLGLNGPRWPEDASSPDDHSIASLVERSTRAGERVALSTEGNSSTPDAGLELATYRIVQEALTNVRKHAPGARVLVLVRYGSDVVDIEVSDTGSAAPRSSTATPGAGLGLVGISERAALFGGESEAGPTLDGGFRVRARLRTEAVLV